MTNSRLNKKRLQNIVDDINECLLSMEEVIQALDKYDDFIQKRLLRSFRPEIMGFKELLGEYTSHCLRSISVNVNDITYLEGIRKTTELGYLEEKDYEFLVKLTKIRNRTAHGYNKPSEKELIEFFIKYKDSFFSIYKTIKNTKDNCDK